MTDVIDSLVGITQGSKLDAIRAQRSEARKHAHAMQRHREYVVETIRELERKQDELLDKLTGKP